MENKLNFFSSLWLRFTKYLTVNIIRKKNPIDRGVIGNEVFFYCG